jgi:hypothetical protein
VTDRQFVNTKPEGNRPISAGFLKAFQNQIVCTNREELNWAMLRLCGQKLMFLSKKKIM